MVVKGVESIYALEWIKLNNINEIIMALKLYNLILVFNIETIDFYLISIINIVFTISNR